MLISWNKYSICNDKILAAVLAMKDLDNISDENINTAHLYYFGFNLVDTNDEFDNLVSLTNNTNLDQNALNLYKKTYRTVDIDGQLRELILDQLAFFRSYYKPQVKNFLKDYNVNLDKLNNSNMYSELMAIKQIINEQRSYLECDPHCKKIFIIVYMNDTPFGGIVVFFNDKLKDLHGSKYIWIQAITKYPTAYIISSLYPELNLPKLNDVLDPIITKVGKELGAEYVYLDPVHKQGIYLEKYYGYRSDLVKVDLPCTNIVKNVDSKIYYKKLI